MLKGLFPPNAIIAAICDPFVVASVAEDHFHA
jgi:hypothetical protein